MTTKPPTHPDAMTPTTPPRPPADPVLESFQETMRAFLEVQKATMLAYLNGGMPGPLAATIRARRTGPCPHLR